VLAGTFRGALVGTGGGQIGGRQQGWWRVGRRRLARWMRLLYQVSKLLELLRVSCARFLPHFLMASARLGRLSSKDEHFSSCRQPIFLDGIVLFGGQLERVVEWFKSCLLNISAGEAGESCALCGSCSPGWGRIWLGDGGSGRVLNEAGRNV